MPDRALSDMQDFHLASFADQGTDATADFLIRRPYSLSGASLPGAGAERIPMIGDDRRAPQDAACAENAAKGR